jgi:ATP synthase protein I
MKTIAPETETEAEESDFKPLTAQEAEQWRRRNPPVSPWKVVLGQVAGWSGGGVGRLDVD